MAKRGRPRTEKYYMRNIAPPKPPKPPPVRVSRKEFVIKRDVDRQMKEIDLIVKSAEKKKRGRPSKGITARKKEVAALKKEIKEMGGTYRKPRAKAATSSMDSEPVVEKDFREVMARNGRMMYFLNGKRIKASEAAKYK